MFELHVKKKRNHSLTSKHSLCPTQNLFITYDPQRVSKGIVFVPGCLSVQQDDPNFDGNLISDLDPGFVFQDYI